VTSLIATSITIHAGVNNPLDAWIFVDLTAAPRRENNDE
jgi:hypothetical protein